MAITLTLGWWLIPLAITVASWAWALMTPSDPSGPFAIDPMPLIRAGTAAIISLFAWLVWALLA